MTKTIKGNLILEKDTLFPESIVVEGSIIGKDGVRYNLKVNGNIDCWDINCRNINCGDIDCWDINCGDIDCLNINCWDIDCKGKINYYAVCFAYYNIKCKSIQGRRQNSRHFVLDGKLIVDGKEKIGK